MTQAQTTEIPVLSEMLDEHADEWTVAGGGKGWKVQFAVDGKQYEVKATSKAQAMTDALGRIQALEDEPAEDEAEGEVDCSDECQTSMSPICQCRCGGENHGAMVAGGRMFTPVMLGDKPCRCGCGQITKREFVAGHDARYATMKAAEAAGVSVEQYRASLKVERNKRAASKRRNKRAAAKAAAPAIEAKAAAVAASVKPTPKHADDLPF